MVVRNSNHFLFAEPGYDRADFAVFSELKKWHRLRLKIGIVCVNKAR